MHKHIRITWVYCWIRSCTCDTHVGEISSGSYTDSSGIAKIKHCVSQFITRRDGGVPSSPDNIFIKSGSQTALMVQSTKIIYCLMNIFHKKCIIWHGTCLHSRLSKYFLCRLCWSCWFVARARVGLVCSYLYPPTLHLLLLWKNRELPSYHTICVRSRAGRCRWRRSAGHFIQAERPATLSPFISATQGIQQV